MGLVTQCIVRFPATSNLSFPAGVILVLSNTISGHFSTSKKSAERRCLSRSALFVSIEVDLILKVTEESSGLAGSAWIVPSNSPKPPRTLEVKWRIVKLASEWFLSMVNASAADRGARKAAETVRERSRAPQKCRRAIGVSPFGGGLFQGNARAISTARSPAPQQ